jgi:hypothetical protein
VTVGSPLQSLVLAADKKGNPSDFPAVSTVSWGLLGHQWVDGCWWLLGSLDFWHFDIILPLDLLRGTTCPKTVVFIPKYEMSKRTEFLAVVLQDPELEHSETLALTIL